MSRIRRQFHPDGRPFAAHALRHVAVGGWQVYEKFYFPDGTMPWHTHDDANVTFFLWGSLEECANGRTMRGEPGRVLYKPAGVRHRNQVGPNGAHVLEIKLGAANAQFDYRWRHTEGDADLARSLLRAIRLDAGSDSPWIDELCTVATIPRSGRGPHGGLRGVVDRPGGGAPSRGVHSTDPASGCGPTVRSPPRVARSRLPPDRPLLDGGVPAATTCRGGGAGARDS
ncbi:MAG: hypothetical protein R3E12_02220 [Candidatus Eisenbacteria bacterium]